MSSGFLPFAANTDYYIDTTIYIYYSPSLLPRPCANTRTARAFLQLAAVLLIFVPFYASSNGTAGGFPGGRSGVQDVPNLACHMHSAPRPASHRQCRRHCQHPPRPTAATTWGDIAPEPGPDQRPHCPDAPRRAVQWRSRPCPQGCRSSQRTGARQGQQPRQRWGPGPGPWPGHGGQQQR